MTISFSIFFYLLQNVYQTLEEQYENEDWIQGIQGGTSERSVFSYLLVVTTLFLLFHDLSFIGVNNKQGLVSPKFGIYVW